MIGTLTPVSTGTRIIVPILPIIPNVINGTAGNDTDLFGTSMDDEIYGFAGNDSLYGLAGNDLLDGGTGADVMAGGTGNDTYVVDNAGDVVWEWGGEGTDTVVSSISYQLSNTLERLFLQGSAFQGTGNELSNEIGGNAYGNALYGLDGNDTLDGRGGNDLLDGGTGDDRLFGGSGEDSLVGADGNDKLDGGAGADAMAGGTGHDTYFVDNTGDITLEFDGQGYDTVHASVNHTLLSSVEKLVLVEGSAALEGYGNTLDNRIEGNSANNYLWGGDGSDELVGNGGADILIGGNGADSLDGGTGADTMAGGTGNDIYRVDDGGDIVFEWGGEGNDQVVSSVDFTLPEGVEHLNLVGPALNGIGNSADNVIAASAGGGVLFGRGGHDSLIGNPGDDTLFGEDGNDSLYGGGGFDVMIGGAGSDRFLFYGFNGTAESGAGGAPPDQILDFVSDRFAPGAGDKIDLSGIKVLGPNGPVDFTFIGNNNNFTPGLLAQVRCNGGFVEGDIDGDQNVDFRIQVFQTDNLLVAADFIL
jgi:Ca2+-binding RTX toxin-like protein